MGRRRWLGAVGIGMASSMLCQGGLQESSAAAEGEPVTVPGKRPLILHNDYPEDLETPLSEFTSWHTPNDLFFVRQHLPVPRVDPDSWRLTIAGRVSRPGSLSLEELRQYPQQAVTATLECAGNGRANFKPRVPGIQWKAGAIGNAEWRGVRVADVLSRAGLDHQAGYVEFDGEDSGVANTPDFVRSLPLSKALHPSTLIALEMNGEPLPRLHGHPARLIVPGWDGACWVKWLSRLTVQEQPADGFFMKPAYRFPRRNVIPGMAAKPEELEVIEGMPVRSVITNPERGSRPKFGPLSIRGFAWAGEEKVEKVEVSTDGGGQWSTAEITSPSLRFAWVLWEYRWKPERPGFCTILSRATDSSGRCQPIEATWNPSGYLWNAIDKVGIYLEE
ncbi:MAG: sulfite oxidase [Acidobacteriota bacterium]